MEIEYSNEERGKTFAYRFIKWERQTIAKALKPEIKKLEKKIERIENDPNNEGQVTYLEAIREHRFEIKMLQEIIKEFSE